MFMYIRFPSGLLESPISLPSVRPQFSGSWATAFTEASPFSPLNFPSHLLSAVDRTWGLELDGLCSNPSLASS